MSYIEDFEQTLGVENWKALLHGKTRLLEAIRVNPIVAIRITTFTRAACKFWRTQGYKFIDYLKVVTVAPDDAKASDEPNIVREIHNTPSTMEDPSNGCTRVGFRVAVFKSTQVSASFAFQKAADVLLAKPGHESEAIEQALCAMAQAKSLVRIRCLSSQFRVKDLDWLSIIEPSNPSNGPKDIETFEVSDLSTTVLTAEEARPLLIEREEDDPTLTALESGYGDTADDRGITPEEVRQRREKEAVEVRKILDDHLASIKDITTEQRAKLTDLVQRNIDIFATDQATSRMSKLAPITAELMKDSPPINQPARSMSFEKLQFLQGKIRDSR